jgi:hypothetical protein
MTTKPPLQRFFKEFCTQKVKANKTVKGQAVQNYRRRKGKKKGVTLIQLHIIKL